MESQHNNIQDNEKTKEKSTFRLITKVLIWDSLILLWKNTIEILSILKYYLIFGLFPKKEQSVFDEQLKYSKIILGIYFVLTIFRIFFSELLDTESAPSLFQNMTDLVIVVFYYVGIILFCLIGKVIAFICYKHQDKRTIEAYMLKEFNFLFLLYFVLIFLGIQNNKNIDGWFNSLAWFSLFCWLHSSYSYFVVFKKNISFRHFKKTFLIFPFIITIVMLFIMFFIALYDSMKFQNFKIS